MNDVRVSVSSISQIGGAKNTSSRRRCGRSWWDNGKQGKFFVIAARLLRQARLVFFERNTTRCRTLLMETERHSDREQYEVLHQN